MNLTGEYAIVPLALASLLTGPVSPVGTEGGLLQYYWELLVLTAFATAAMLVHVDVRAPVAMTAAATVLATTDLTRKPHPAHRRRG
ncbi:hypothetical protein IV498_09625 [Paenarthrobacter sp. Z7-10]|uniref:hypothetical protein n=1 Tax=Paenarthrobacter sp. Z7-10 TaxID=2787635 RepID=UPI0022A96E41|nr:hypothetical protein [Paenarthrobacter sp. Z7-10]MCZ2403434.1 hypothetical protein [Paenarthrobacter sp. Z7-10]